MSSLEILSLPREEPFALHSRALPTAEQRPTQSRSPPPPGSFAEPPSPPEQSHNPPCVRGLTLSHRERLEAAEEAADEHAAAAEEMAVQLQEARTRRI